VSAAAAGMDALVASARATAADRDVYVDGAATVRGALAAGVIGGAAMGISAIAQGMASASSCDAFGETGKGFGQYITVVGLCETVALFVMAFTFGAI